MQYLSKYDLMTPLTLKIRLFFSPIGKENIMEIEVREVIEVISELLLTSLISFGDHKMTEILIFLTLSAILYSGAYLI